MDANSKRTPSTPKAQAKASTTKSHTQQALAQVNTLGELAEAYPAHLLAVGKSEGTSASYRGDLRVAIKHFGENTKLSTLTRRRVKGYFESDLVTKTKKREPKNPITTAKLCRVFRQGLVWLAEEGHLAEAPIPGDNLSRQKMSE